METGQCIVDRAVKLDTVDGATLDGGAADLDSIDVERILERACYGARRRRSIYQAPEFTKRLKTLENVRTGEKVQFECHWTAFPRPAVKWYHDDEEINTDDERFEIETQRRGVLILTLKSATRADEGSYKCKAENQEGVTSTTGYLSVTGDSRKSRSRESRRKRQRAVSLPPHLRTITEQRSLEEKEEVACSRQPRSPIQDFLDNIESFRKDRTWPLLSRHHGADDKRTSTAQKWDDVDSSESPTATAAVVVDAGSGAVGGKSSFERVLDNCENPFAKRPLLPFADDRVVTSEGDLTPNGRDLSPPSRPTSLWLGPAAAARNASDTCGRLPGRIVFPTTKKYKPIVVADVTSALKADAAAEQTSPARKPAVPPKKPVAHRKPDGGLVVDVRQRARVSPDGGRHTGDGRKPVGARTESKEKVYARVSGILCEDKTGDSAKVSMAGLADAIAACGWQGQGQQLDDSATAVPLQPAVSSESAAHPKPDESSESPVRSPSVDSGLRSKPVSIVSPVGTSVDADDSPVCPPPAVCRSEDIAPVPDPVTLTADSAADDDVDAKTSARTCTAVAPSTASKAEPQRPVLLYFFLFVTVCAYVGCSLQSYPANFIFVVTALSMISFRLLLRRADFLGKS